MEILKKLGVIQEVSNEGRNPKLGRGFSTARRFNKWHPLSYIIIPMVWITVFIVDGITGIKQSNPKNPFKWD
jgi:hypothetical protein